MTFLALLFSLYVLSTAKKVGVDDYVTIAAAEPASGPIYTLTNFTTDKGAKGRFAVVHKPIGNFHIYYPEEAAGKCGGLEFTSRQSLVHSCDFATNGGPFSFHDPTCLGNIVSDGKIIQTGGGGEVIGLTHTKKWILGSVTSRTVPKLDFVQLTSGFNWLTRKGVVMPAAGGEIAPRTFAGINKKGELLLFVVDGHEVAPAVGLTLKETAEIALHHGCDYAINLDGGGSSVACSHGKLLSDPTCHDTPSVCERKVTTVTCVTH